MAVGGCDPSMVSPKGVLHPPLEKGCMGGGGGRGGSGRMEGRKGARAP